MLKHALNAIQQHAFHGYDMLEVRKTGTCLVLPALSYPSATVLIKRTEKPIRVLVSTALDECDFISHAQ
jgi:hypothetical protein